MEHVERLSASSNHKVMVMDALSWSTFLGTVVLLCHQSNHVWFQSPKYERPTSMACHLPWPGPSWFTRHKGWWWIRWQLILDRRNFHLVSHLLHFHVQEVFTDCKSFHSTWTVTSRSEVANMLRQGMKNFAAFVKLLLQQLLQVDLDMEALSAVVAGFMLLLSSGYEHCYCNCTKSWIVNYLMKGWGGRDGNLVNGM